MKNALIIGGGSGKGAIIVDTLLENGFSVVNVGSSEHSSATNIKIAWDKLDIPFVQRNLKFNQLFDFIFFNQNSSTLKQEDFIINDETLTNWKLIKDWSHSHWISCQFPFLLLHTNSNNLHSNTKVGWMLSGYIRHDKPDVEKYPDYSSFKFFNLMQMRSFSSNNKFKTFGIYPDFSQGDGDKTLKDIIQRVLVEDTQEYYF